MRKTRITSTPVLLFTLAFSVNACSGGGTDDQLVIDADASAPDGKIDGKVDGTAGQGGGSTGDGGGGKACKTAADCPDTGNECTVPECVNNVCTVAIVQKSTPTATQIEGDCKQAQCDGNGGVVQVDDDDDIPDDENSCTHDTCHEGSPKHTPKALGESCKNGWVCDGAGKCVACNTADDCDGEDTFCAIRTCNSNACGIAHRVTGTPLPESEQTEGDCAKYVCNDEGKTAKVFDVTDAEDDGNECTIGECAADYTTTQKPLDPGTPCTTDGGKKGLCDGHGVCVQCLDDPDCKSKNLYCDNAHTCQPFRVISITPPTNSDSIEPDTEFVIEFPKEIDPNSIQTQHQFGICTKSSSLRLSFDNFSTCLPFKCSVKSSAQKHVVCNVPMTMSYLKKYSLKVGTTLKSLTGLSLENDYIAGYMVKRPNELGCTSPTDVVISQVYANGGVSDDGYKSDFIVLRNRSISPVSLNGWSLQYSGDETPGQWQQVNLENTIQAGGYYLIKGYNGPKGRDVGPSHVQFSFDIDTASGVLALVSHTKPLNNCPKPGSSQLPPPRDMVGFGKTTCFRKSVAPSPEDMQLLRRNDGCTFEDNNGTDFRVGPSVFNTINTPSLNCTCGFNGSKETSNLADLCLLDSPAEMSLVINQLSSPVIGIVHKEGLITPPDPNKIKAQLGWGPVDVNPSTQCGYSFVDGVSAPTMPPYVPSEARYQAQFMVEKPGQYRYVYRFSVDGGATWLYCNLNKTLPSDGNFDITQLGKLEVTVGP